MTPITCLTCKNIIGEAAPDGKNIYNFHDQDRQPICPWCDENQDVKGYKIVIAISLLILIGLGLINIFC